MTGPTSLDKVFRANLWGLPDDPAGRDLCELALQAIQRMGTGGQFPAPMGGHPAAAAAGWGTWATYGPPVPYREAGLAGGARFDAQAPYQQASPAVSMSFKTGGSVRLTGYGGVLVNENQAFIQLTFTTDPGPPYWLATISEEVVLHTVDAVAGAIRDQAGEPPTTPVFQMVRGQWTPPHADWPTTI